MVVSRIRHEKGEGLCTALLGCLFDFGFRWRVFCGSTIAQLSDGVTSGQVEIILICSPK